MTAAMRVFVRDGYSGASIETIAAEAAVSKQTIYNHLGDKQRLFESLIDENFDQVNAQQFAMIETFPDRPANLMAELTAFAGDLMRGCLMDERARALRTLVQAEGSRRPEIARQWRQRGQDQLAGSLAARFARLALAGKLSMVDPDQAARDFLALITYDAQVGWTIGDATMRDDELDASIAAGVRTFMRAYGNGNGSNGNGNGNGNGNHHHNGNGNGSPGG
ncbi:TetR/AcrR family transcriptional regulator [Nonomuraea sp. NPDC026600]|uniref:TetR/AcrR family transcriptional regulator n=1 Tax=Nonomuraea sp. NPDC026600 TaxID=3155363 RepID=UPI0033DCDAB1